MIIIKNIDLEYEEVEQFLLKVKKGIITPTEKNTLYLLVKQLTNRSDRQKERFLLYYNLNPNQSEQYNFTQLGKSQGCSSNAIRYSTIRIRSALVNSKNDKKETFVNLVRECNKKGD